MEIHWNGKVYVPIEYRPPLIGELYLCEDGCCIDKAGNNYISNFLVVVEKVG